MLITFANLHSSIALPIMEVAYPPGLPASSDMDLPAAAMAADEMDIDIDIDLDPGNEDPAFEKVSS